MERTLQIKDDGTLSENFEEDNIDELTNFFDTVLVNGVKENRPFKKR